jgi:hypothetical protein
MTQFICDKCDAEFEKKSLYDRHMIMLHPEPAPSAVAIETALGKVRFPKSRDQLVIAAAPNRELEAIFRSLPDKQYRDAAEVARAFSALRSPEDKSEYQSGINGGIGTAESLSAARIARLFSGIEFPASSDDLKAYARPNASDEEMQLVERFPDHTYHDLKEVVRELGNVSR